MSLARPRCHMPKIEVNTRVSRAFVTMDSRARATPQSSMKSLTEHLWFQVPGRRGFVNITSTIEDLVMKSGVNEGLCLVNAMHITASVFINDNESGLHHDGRILTVPL